MKMGKAALWVITVGTWIIYTSADSCTHHAAIGQPYELPLPLPKGNRIRWMFGGHYVFDSKRTPNTNSATPLGALILPKVTQSDGGSYTAETVNTEGSIDKKVLVLCVQEIVSKPTVKVKCDEKTSKVQFTCSVAQAKNVKYEWSEGGKVIKNENAETLLRTSKQLGSNSFTCKVSNFVSTQTSDSAKSDCFKSAPDDKDAWLFGLPYWLMVGILAGGGGLVLVLIVATIVCCSINRRKRRMHMKDEQELRLHWSTSTQQNNHHSNQRGHAHGPAHGPAHSHGPAPSPRPTPAPHGPTSAGHTGPRPPRARQNRPRPPDPITGQPLPGPRRQAGTGQTQINNDEENPPPLPQPRKKGPRT